MTRNLLKRFVAEEDGMEMIEWAIVAIFFAVAGSFIWEEVATAIQTQLQDRVIGRLEQ